MTASVRWREQIGPEWVLAGLLVGVLSTALLGVPGLRAADRPLQAVVAAPVGPTAAPLPRPVALPGPTELTPSAAAPAPLTPAAPPPAAPTSSPAPPALAAAAPLEGEVQQRVQTALDSLGYPWQELGWDIRFVPHTGGFQGLAEPATRQITIFVKPRSTVQELWVVLAHEIGHALDNAVPGQRARYRELRGIPADLPWFSCAYCEDFDSPAGDFAEVFAAWLVGATDFRSRLAPLPDDALFAALTPLFAPPSVRAAPPPPEQTGPPPAPSPSPSPSRSRGLFGVGGG